MRPTHRRYSCIEVRVREIGYIGSVERYTGAKSFGERIVPCLEYRIECPAALMMEGMCTAGVSVTIYIASYSRRQELSSASP